MAVCTDNSVIDARQHFDPSARVLVSADRLVVEVVARLRDRERIEISFEGVYGIPSSYFNKLLLAIAREFGVDALTKRITFRFSTDAQRDIFQRSLDAVTKSLE